MTEQTENERDEKYERNFFLLKSFNRRQLTCNVCNVQL